MGTLSSITESGTTQTSPHTVSQQTELPLGIAWVHPQVKITKFLGKSIVLGRDGDANERLPGRQVSRRHAQLSKTHHGWMLRDLDSKNGINVNGARIREAALAEQDVVRIGEWIGIVTTLTEAQLRAERIVMPCGELCWGGAHIQIAYEILCRAATADLSVMLVGETGTGKEVFARRLHEESDRSGAFIATNCATIPEHMAEGELFGYRRGAFTGADRANLGHFRAAHKGTLFLDEISDLPAKVQVKILRAIQEKAVVPLGQSKSEPAFARIVCAAQHPLHEYVEQGLFRPDLYSRLNGVEVRIPPLRKRREEILFHFQRTLNAKNILLSPDVAEQLCIYDWPLNVREVLQLAERTKALHSDARRLDLQHLPERIATFSAQETHPSSYSPTKAYPLTATSSAEAECLPARDQLAHDLAQALRESGGNVSLAAKKLGVSRPMAYRLMKRLPEIDPEEIRVQAIRS